MKKLSVQKFLGAFALAALAHGSVNAGLILTVNSATSDRLSLSISGSFDADTVGQSEGYLAIKNNWSANVGTHTEMFSFAPTVSINTITIGGFSVSTFVQDGLNTWMDNVFFVNPFGSENAIAAGTVVSGTIVLDGVGAFSPANLSTLQLVSGFNRPSGRDDWARLEARASNSNAVPEPGSVALLLAAGVAAFAGLRRRTQS